MNSLFLKRILVLFSLIISSLFVFLSVVFCAYISYTGLFSGKDIKSTQGDYVEWKDYQTLNYDSTSKEFFFGTSTILSKHLGESDFIFSSHRNGQIFNLVSQIGENEYICTGRCFCDDMQRRSGGTKTTETVTRGMVYLLVAISSLVAYDLAGTYFREECLHELSDGCVDHESIKSEVVDCELALEASTTTTTKEENQEEDELEYDVLFEEGVFEKEGEEEDDDFFLEDHEALEEKEEVWRYRCRGKCDVKEEYYFRLFSEVLFDRGELSFSEEIISYNKETDGEERIQQFQETVEHIGNKVDFSFRDNCNKMELSEDVEVKVILQNRETDFVSGAQYQSWLMQVRDRAFNAFYSSLHSFCGSNSKISDHFGTGRKEDFKALHYNWLKMQSDRDVIDLEEYVEMIEHDDDSINEVCTAAIILPHACRKLPNRRKKNVKQ